MGLAFVAPSNDEILDNGLVEPPYGSRLLPNVVDELAEINPERIYATIPLSSSDVSQGFRNVTMFQVAQSVNHFAFWLDQSFGRSSTFETLTYMGVPDFRYAIVFLAAVKCGYKLLVPSVRNTTWMNLSLLEQTNCVKFLYTTEMYQKVQDLQLEKKNLRALAVSSLDDLTRQRSKIYPYKATYENNRWDPILILHSSGSTGPPKPVETNHATWAVADNDRNLPTVKGRKIQSWARWNFDGDGGRYFSAFPPFHLGGVMTMIVLPIYSTTATVVLGPADRPATGYLASQMMQQYRLRALFCPPAIFEQLVQEPQGLEQAKRLDFISYAGGPLSIITGDLLSQVTDVCQFYGSTETGAIPQLVPRREDWASLEWHPSCAVDMQSSEDNAFEMVLKRSSKVPSSLFCNFPDVEEWHTRDLFLPQPGKANLWRFHGRKDDIIVLSNGEKFNPVPSEGIIAEHHLLSAALIVGLGRFQVALLLEPNAETGIEEDSLIESVWPIVERANAQAPGHGRIIRSMIAVADTSKRFERAGKGTVIRKTTAQKFAPEIETLYSKKNLEVSGPRLGLDATDNLKAIQDYVRVCIDFSFSAPSLEEESDLFVFGLDSLKTIEIAGILKAGLPRDSDTSWLSAQTIYVNPTIQSLSKVLQQRLSPKGNYSGGEHDVEQLRITRMTSLVHKYTQDLPVTQIKENEALQRSKLNIVLTGSTGSLGTYLLRSLLNDSAISKIYCLNRSANARAKQEEGFKRLGLRHNLESVDFIRAEYGQSDLGLTEAQYKQLTSDVDLIIHNAWKVDFHHSLESFEPVHIRGVRNFLDWSISSSRHPRIMFISSASSVGNRNSVHPGEQVAETPISSHHSAQQMGYGESKNVAECILDIGNKKSGVPVSILRVGQIAGPVTMAAGIWNRDEWFPSLVKTSQSLGCLPSYLPDVDWIPVDILADAILDIAHCTVDTDHTWIYNIVNPTSTAWATLTATVLKRLGPQTKVVELSAWIHMLAQLDQSDAGELAAKPAAKILDFYQALEGEKAAGGLKYSTAHGIASSTIMAELEPVSVKWMDIWLDQWGYK